jgi:hypothetical protein
MIKRGQTKLTKPNGAYNNSLTYRLWLLLPKNPVFGSPQVIDSEVVA